MADININMSQASGQIDAFTASLQTLSAYTESEFGKMTQKINLFGTNVAKRLERCSAAVKSFGDSYKEVGNGIGAITDNIVVGIDKITGGINGAVSKLAGMSSNVSSIGGDINGLSNSFSNFGGSMQDIGGGLSNIGGGVGDLGSGLGGFGGGLSTIGGGVGEIGSGFENVGGGIIKIGEGFSGLGTGFSSASKGLTELGSSLPIAGEGFMKMAQSLDGIINYVPEIIIFGGALYGLTLISAGLQGVGASILNIGNGMMTMANSLTVASGAFILLSTSLPLVGLGFMQMLINLAPMLEYLPQLLIFVATMLIFSLIGAGLIVAGQGLSAIAAGFLAMGEALPCVIDGMILLVEYLANTTLNLGGIILFVLLAAAMFIMALSITEINKELIPMVEALTKMSEIFSVGFVVGFSVFTVMMVLLSTVMKSSAKGIDKVTAALKKQAAQLRILIPLQSMSAVLANPIVGAITVALAAAAGVLMNTLMPAMATGGVVSSPTVAMVGEGKYPEAVVPLGSSPQFASMKNDIANAVVQAIMSLGGGKQASAGSPVEIVLSLDGERFARAIIPAIDRENRRKGYVAQLKSL